MATHTQPAGSLSRCSSLSWLVCFWEERMLLQCYSSLRFLFKNILILVCCICVYVLLFGYAAGDCTYRAPVTSTFTQLLGNCEARSPLSLSARHWRQRILLPPSRGHGPQPKPRPGPQPRSFRLCPSMALRLARPLAFRSLVLPYACLCPIVGCIMFPLALSVTSLFAPPSAAAPSPCSYLIT